MLGIGVAILNRIVKAKLTQVTFEQKPEEGEEASQLAIWGRSVQAKGRATAKFPRRACLDVSATARGKCGRRGVNEGRVIEDEVTEGRKAVSHRQGFGFYSERDGKPLKGLSKGGTSSDMFYKGSDQQFSRHESEDNRQDATAIMQARNEGVKVGGVGCGDLDILSEELRERKITVNDDIQFFTRVPGKMELPLYLGEIQVLGGRS